ncbi:zeta toxin [Acinetobacter sp. ANC 4648]|uniref:zeta toxin n=1 Tax=Acinetobacter sp. ANC 4648 TaxID=1977875 RepID=UPI000A342E51|nr:zeta toxin [Acinetobacter sp. ANC 4648]OTG80369.1 zeta toxin [Acinetobacter sp. ANC 4648]
MPQPRIRMFAGPNGSGKSTIKDYLPPHQIGAYLNADELEKNLSVKQVLCLSDYHESLSAEALIQFLKQTKRKNGESLIPLLSSEPVVQIDGSIQFETNEIDSYLAARIIDFIRVEFLRLKISFTFETVMSHISKVEFLRAAQRQGFKTYLYYVATVDPAINIARVHYRILTGGHAVPEHKIRERYYRSLALLMPAIEASDRAYIFDNSSNGQKVSFIAEIDDAETLKLNPEVKLFPKWFVDQILNEFT